MSNFEFILLNKIKNDFNMNLLTELQNETNTNKNFKSKQIIIKQNNFKLMFQFYQETFLQQMSLLKILNKIELI